MEKELFKCNYFTFFDDGSFGCSDGVGYCGEVSANEARSLYEAMQKYYSPADATLRARLERIEKALDDLDASTAKRYYAGSATQDQMMDEFVFAKQIRAALVSGEPKAKEN